MAYIDVYIHRCCILMFNYILFHLYNIILMNNILPFELLYDGKLKWVIKKEIMHDDELA